MPNVYAALGTLPRACGDSVEHVAVALAESTSNREIPTGYGATLVRHFRRRSKQLESIVGLQAEYRFALIELTLLASISGGWEGSSRQCVTVAGHREYVRQVAQVTRTTHIEREQWRRVIALLLDSPDTSSILLRRLARALVWCGYFSTDMSAMSDEHIAQHFFGVDRTEFAHHRQEALRWLPAILKGLILPPAGGIQ